MEQLIPELVKYGATGIIFLLIGVVVYIIKDYHKLLSNHLNHLTGAYEKNTEVMERVIGNNTKATQELRDVVMGCKFNHHR